MSNELDDNELIRRFQKDDERAFDELVKRYLLPIYRYAKTFFADNDVAEEITQEVIIKVWKNLKKFKVSQPFKPWLYTIIRNTALDELKRRKPYFFSQMSKDDEVTFEETLESDLELPHEVFEAARRKDQIEEVLKSFDPKKQEIIILHLYDDLTFQEISEVIGMPLNTVKSLFRRTVLQMKGELEKIL